jgi:hypothetical protein
MPEQYGTAGGGPLTWCAGPVVGLGPSAGVTQRELFTGGRKVRLSSPFHWGRQRSPPGRGGRSGVCDEGSDQDHRDGHGAAVRCVVDCARTPSLRRPAAHRPAPRRFARLLSQFFQPPPGWLMSPRYRSDSDCAADCHRARLSGPPPFPLRSRGPARWQSLRALDSRWSTDAAQADTVRRFGEGGDTTPRQDGGTGRTDVAGTGAANCPGRVGGPRPGQVQPLTAHSGRQRRLRRGVGRDDA